MLQRPHLTEAEALTTLGLNPANAHASLLDHLDRRLGELAGSVEDALLAFLGRADVRRIAAGMLRNLARTLQREQGVELEVDESALDALVDLGGFDAELGARPMRRTIGREVETPLSTRLLEGNLQAGDRVRLVGSAQGIEFELLASAVAS